MKRALPEKEEVSQEEGEGAVLKRARQGGRKTGKGSHTSPERLALGGKDEKSKGQT